MRKAQHILALATMATLPMTAASSLAATYTWTAGPGTQNWSTGWGSGYPSAPADIATIPSLSGNLLVNIDVANATLGSLTFGSTGFNTDIGNNNATGNAITLDQTGGSGNGTITSAGTGTNTISAPVILAGVAAGLTTFDITAASTADLTFGAITNTAGNHQLNISTTKAVTIAGPLQLTNDATNRTLTIVPTSGAGTLTISGNISNGGTSTGSTLTIGQNQTSATFVYPKVILSGDNSGLTNMIANRIDLDVRNDKALNNGGVLQFVGAANIAGTRITSTTGARKIDNIRVRNGTFITFYGDNSFEFTGLFGFSANRSINNMLNPATASLTLNDTYASDTTNDNRVFVADGAGNTLIKGNLLYSNLDAPAGGYTGVGSLDKRGTGNLIIQGNTTVSATQTIYTGNTRVRSGLLEFGKIEALGTSGGITVEAGGAIGLQTGSLNTAFVNRIITGAGNGSGQAGGNTTDPNTSRGALALSAADAAANIDFVSGPLAAANTVNMGIGAVSAGVTFTGTINPAANTYRLGGGGKLTLPNAQLTGAGNSTVLTNGGTTALQGANTYGGSTTVGGNYVLPSQVYVNNGQSTQLVTTPFSLRVNSTLEVSSLTNGGTSSPIGNSSSAASNLVLNGGTLRHAGAGASSTDRLFTIGTNGATLDSSGTGTVAFTNTGAIVNADAGTRAGTIDTSTRFVGISDVSDLTPGMTVTGTNIPANTTISAVLPASSFANFGGGPNVFPYYIILSQGASASGATPDLVFGNQNRTLTLTGSNAGANSVAGALSNSASGTLGVTKTGAGTWGLSGTNTYTGATTVSGGVLSVNTPAAISAASAVTVGGGTGAAVYKIGWNGATTSATIALPTLSTNGRFDIAQGRVVLTGTTEAAVAALVGNGANGTGTIFTSSFGGGKAVGYSDAGGTGITVRYTYQGDADLNGLVDFNDFLVLQNNFNNAGRFDQGDFDYNGTVDFNDFLVLQNNFNKNITSGAVVPMTADQVAAITAFAATVPEPTSLALLGLGAAAALRRRRAC